MNNDNDIIKINLDIFQNKMKNYIYNDINIDNLNKKKKDLLDTYSCFNEKYDSKFLWEKKKLKKNYYKTNYISRNDTVNNNDKKLYTFTTNKFNINKEKKSFILLLNKLSDNNKEVIKNEINNIIKSYSNISELLEIIYLYIGKNNDKLYIEILKNIIEINNNIFYDFLKKVDYIINDKYIDNNIMLDENYDDFCDFKKNKTKYINYFNSFIELINNDCDIIILDILENITIKIVTIVNNLENSRSYVINYYLELLLILKKEIKLNTLNIDLSKYDKSTKFIMDKFNL